MRKTGSGFTIAELLVVIAVIGILATIGIVSFSSIQSGSRDKQRSSRITALAEALEKYYDEYGEYPSCEKMILEDPVDVVTNTLHGLDPNVLTAPKAAEGTNSIVCTDISGEGDDVIAYIGYDCVANEYCSKYTLKYRLEVESSDCNDSIICEQTSRRIMVEKSGQLSYVGTGAIGSGSNPYIPIVSPDGSSVYVTNLTNHTVSMYSRNTSTGSLTALSPDMIATGVTPAVITVSADGSSVYVGSFGELRMYSRDNSTGILTYIGTTASGVWWPLGIAISADGKSVYLSSSLNNHISRYSRNTGTGILTYIDTIAAGTSPRGIAISADGKSVYAANYLTNNISMYSRNTSTGALMSIGTIAAGGSPSNIVISTNGNSVYVENYATNNVSMYSRDPETGALMSIGTINTEGTYPNGIAISHDGKSVYVSNHNSHNISMYKRNIITGALSFSDIPDETHTFDLDPTMGEYPTGITISPDGNSVYLGLSASTILLFNR